MSLYDNIKRQLTRDEGREKSAYTDSLGYITIGVGRLIDKRKNAGLRDSEIDFLLENDIDEVTSSLEMHLPWVKNLDEARYGALVNMAFQLGVDGLLKFDMTLHLIKTGNYGYASAEMLNSLWAKQTPARANRLAYQIRTGEWQ